MFISDSSRIDTKIEEYKKIWGDIPGIGPDYSSAVDYSWGDLPGEFDEYSPGTKDTSQSSTRSNSYSSDYQYEAEYIPYKVKNPIFSLFVTFQNRTKMNYLAPSLHSEFSVNRNSM